MRAILAGVQGLTKIEVRFPHCPLLSIVHRILTAVHAQLSQSRCEERDAEERCTDDPGERESASVCVQYLLADLDWLRLSGVQGYETPDAAAAVGNVQGLTKIEVRFPHCRFAYTAPTTLIPTVPPIERNKAKVAVEVAMSF
jgi:hypothetical protein